MKGDKVITVQVYQNDLGVTYLTARFTVLSLTLDKAFLYLREVPLCDHETLRHGHHHGPLRAPTPSTSGSSMVVQFAEFFKQADFPKIRPKNRFL